MQSKNGSLFIFRLFGVNVYIHWAWAIAVIWFIQGNMESIGWFSGNKHSISYQIGRVLVLFVIVLLHEFGHALACKSVGGTVDTIILWPLGGAAYVSPPQRPGAVLWSILAGPLVNMALVPITIGLVLLSRSLNPGDQVTDFMYDMAITNIWLLVINMLPVYPLDGGRILWSLLWFLFGRGTSLIIAAVIGVIGSALFVLLAIYLRSIWTGMVAVFMGMNSINSVKLGVAMRRFERGPRHPDAICPNCHQHPPVGNFWKCPCGVQLDTFASGSHCPTCDRSFEMTSCPLCGQSSPPMQWYSARAFPVEQPPVEQPVEPPPVI